MNKTTMAALPRPLMPVPPTLKNAPPLSEYLERTRKLKIWLAVIFLTSGALLCALVLFYLFVVSESLASLLTFCALVALIALYLTGSNVFERIADFKPLPESELADLRRNLLGEVYKDAQTDETRAELRRYGNEVRALERPFMLEDLKVLRRYNAALSQASSEMRQYVKDLADFQLAYGVTMSEGVSE